MKNLRAIFVLFWIPLTCLSQDITGKWCANYRSANNDGSFTDCFIIQKKYTGLEALRWMTALCSSCKTLASRRERIHRMPERYRAESLTNLLTDMNLLYAKGALLDIDGDPSGEELIFYKEEKFQIKPSFNCSIAKQPREQAICSNPELSLLDLELSFVFSAAKGCNPKGNLDVSQNSWWRDELSRCQSGECVPLIYATRIEVLRQQCK